jgi:hypothetical protein
MQVKSDAADEDLAQKLYAFCSQVAGLPDEAIGYAPLPALKKIRHSVTEASNLEMRALGGGRLSFDTATPVDRFGDYLAQLARELRAARPDVQLVDFGHAGVGGAHLHLIGGAGSPVAADAERLTQIRWHFQRGTRRGPEVGRRVPAADRARAIAGTGRAQAARGPAQRAVAAQLRLRSSAPRLSA